MTRKLGTWLTPIVVVLLLTLVACGPTGSDGEGSVDAGAWPEWRGAGGQGTTQAADLPVQWGVDSSNIRWQVEVPGQGSSSPVISGDKVFLTTALPPNLTDHDRFVYSEPGATVPRVAVAYHLDSGELAWQTTVADTAAEKLHRLTSFASATPVTDGKHLYVYYGEVLASLSFTGELRWSKVVEEGFAAESHYGASSSPVLFDDMVIVAQDREQADSKDTGWLAAFDKETGEELWRNEWEFTCCSYSTPLVVGEGEDRRLLFAHSGMVAEYDPATGDRLWEHSYSMMQVVSSLVTDGDLLFIAGGAHTHRGTVVVRLSGRGKDTTVEPVWEAWKAAPNTASPVLVNDIFYTVNDGGVLTAYDAASGEVHYRKRLPWGEYNASLLASDDMVYAVSTWGPTVVVRADSRYQLLAENHFAEGEGALASPAIGGGCLLLRTWNYLYCIEQENPPFEMPPLRPRKRKKAQPPTTDPPAPAAEAQPGDQAAAR